MTRIIYEDDEFYHIYNRGVERRLIFSDRKDVDRFLKSMEVFNRKEPVGSLYELSFDQKKLKNTNRNPLVSVVAYALNPNHYHLLLQQESSGGISEYIKRLIGGYTWYFNNRHKRSGSLFQGKHKSKHVSSNEYLQYVSAYINLNSRVHQLGGPTAKLVRSSMDEYVYPHKINNKICDTLVVLDQFKNRKDYARFCYSALKTMVNRKKLDEELKHLLIEVD